MKWTDIILCKSATDYVWDYGFGIYGLGTYLWYWEKIILFIPEIKTKKHDTKKKQA